MGWPGRSFDLFVLVQTVPDHRHVKVTKALDLFYGHSLPNELLLHGPDLLGRYVCDHGVETGLGHIRVHATMKIQDEALELGDLVLLFGRIRHEFRLLVFEDLFCFTIPGLGSWVCDPCHRGGLIPGPPPPFKKTPSKNPGLISSSSDRCRAKKGLLPVMSPLRKNPKDYLEGVSFFRDLSPEALDLVAERMVYRSAPAGSVLFRKGEGARGVYVLVKGRVEIYRSTADGREQVLHTETPVQSIAELPVFDGGEYPASARTAEDSDLYFLSSTISSGYTENIRRSLTL